jgi:hypothetical protein
MKKYDAECCCAVKNTKKNSVIEPASPNCIEGGGVIVYHTDKKENKFSSYKGKFRVERLQSHI